MSTNIFKRTLEKPITINCQYYGLLSAIPSSWTELLKSQTGNLSPSTPTIECLTCKIIYHLLINRKNLPPPTADKRLVRCGFDPSQRRKVYSLPFAVIKEVKLAVFQFKLIHNIFSTNSLLYKMKIIDSPRPPTCPFCPDTEQSIVHLFVRCSSAVSFWNEFTEWYRSQCKEHSVTAFTEYEILYGVLKDSSSLQTINHLILVGKFFLFICAKNNKKYQFADFVVSVREKIELEKYIATRENKLTQFNLKWKDFLQS